MLHILKEPNLHQESPSYKVYTMSKPRHSKKDV